MFIFTYFSTLVLACCPKGQLKNSDSAFVIFESLFTSDNKPIK